MHLQGLGEIAGSKLLQDKGLQVTAEASKQLIESYQGNPLAIKIAATAIKDLFAGNVSQFLAQEIRVFNGLRLHLSHHFNGLYDLEKQVMYGLAISREPVSLSALQANIMPSVSSRELLEALEDLIWRSLIEKTATGFTQQPVIMEYVTQTIIESIVEEILTEKIALLNTCALSKPQKKDKLKDSQIKLILEPVVNSLLNELGSQQQLESKLKLILAQSQDLPSETGYAASNIMNLLHYLETNQPIFYSNRSGGI